MRNERHNPAYRRVLTDIMGTGDQYMVGIKQHNAVKSSWAGKARHGYCEGTNE